MKWVFGLSALLLAANCSRKADTKGNGSLATTAQLSKVMGDGQIWMTQNLSINIAESYCQQDDSLQCKRYGRLYTWKAAKKGCAQLGDGCRLPTNEEWQALAKPYGGVFDDSNDNGKLAYVKLIEGGSSEFNALLGGNREANGDYQRLGAHGFYWTATEQDSTEAWFYNFGKGPGLLNHHTGDKQRAASVRCIKDKGN